MLFPLVARRSYNEIRTETRFITKQSYSRKFVHTCDSCSLWALSVTRHTSRPTLVARLPVADRLGSLRAGVEFLVGLLLLVMLLVKFPEALGRYRSRETLSTSTTTAAAAAAATTTTTTTTTTTGHALSHLVEALCFKQEGCWFDSR
jgi:hypothetical protein